MRLKTVGKMNGTTKKVTVVTDGDGITTYELNGVKQSECQSLAHVLATTSQYEIQEVPQNHLPDYQPVSH